MTETPVKGVAIMWNPYVPTMVAATREFPWLDLKFYSHRLAGENPEVLDRALRDMESARFILLYRTPDTFWESVDQRLNDAPGFPAGALCSTLCLFPNRAMESDRI